MRVAFITRSTWQTVPGGDTVQLRETASRLQLLGVHTDILTADAKIDYTAYDLLHLFNITRPADLLKHARLCNKPYLLSPVLIDYSEYDRHYRKGISGFIFRHCSPSQNEYIKTIGRRIQGKDKLVSHAYLWKGQQKSMQEIIAGAAAILPNSSAEQTAIRSRFSTNAEYAIIPNGVNTSLFTTDLSAARDKNLVICAARIEGIKNQLTLIKALNNTAFTLVLIGGAAPGQQSYYQQCVKEAASNVRFTGHITQEELLAYYQQAAVHVLPSWFETCGLSSLEAAAMGCNIVITDKGYTRDYFGDDAFYAEPSSPESILAAIQKAAGAEYNDRLRKKIMTAFTWQNAASLTFSMYKKILSR